MSLRRESPPVQQRGGTRPGVAPDVWQAISHRPEMISRRYHPMRSSASRGSARNKAVKTCRREDPMARAMAGSVAKTVTTLLGTLVIGTENRRIRGICKPCGTPRGVLATRQSENSYHE